MAAMDKIFGLTLLFGFLSVLVSGHNDSNIVLQTVKCPLDTIEVYECDRTIWDNCWNNKPVKSTVITETWHAVIAAIVCPCIAIFFIIKTLMDVLNADVGPKEVTDVGDQIHQGAVAYMGRQYKIISIFTVFTAILIIIVLKTPLDPYKGHHGGVDEASPYWVMMIHFVIGSLLSGLSGVGGMHVAFRANVRTCAACADDKHPNPLNKGLRVAFSSGCVMGMSVVTFVVLGQAVLFVIFEDPLALSGFGFGASLVALFSRVGGGIFTKAADVGADLVGKVESGLPEDDPRNPGVIADNVGDNVGDVAGLGADLFESYVGATVAAVPLGYHMHGLSGVALPFWISGVGIICSIIGTFFVRTKPDADQKALLRALGNGVLTSGFLVFFATAFICWKLFDFNEDTVKDGFKLWGCSTLGLVSGVIVGHWTEMTTSDAYYPTKSIAVKGGRTGPATVIIRGLGVGMISALLPGIVLAACALACAQLQGAYGVSIAAIGMLSTLGITLATDAYGPVADNAGGIAEMAKLPKEVREKTDALDALGNTTAATGKGFAIGSALLITLALVSTFTTETRDNEGCQVRIDMTDPMTLAGGIVGSLLPYLFAALTMFAVGRSAEELIVEVRRQFREIDGLLDGREGVKPDSGRCVDICTKAALREMIMPGIIAVMSPIAFGYLLGSKFIGGLLIGSIFSGFFLGVTMANAGGAWDNAKKYVEAEKVIVNGKIMGKGTSYHEAAVVGDTVGDPFKDTSGPALNILAKLMSHLSLIISGSIGYESEKWAAGLAIWIIIFLCTIAGCIYYKLTASIEVRMEMADSSWADLGLDDAKNRLEFQKDLLQQLNKTARVGPDRERFQIGELYNLYGEVEVTFTIQSKGFATNNRAIYATLVSEKNSFSGKYLESCTITFSDSERTKDDVEKLLQDRGAKKDGTYVPDQEVKIHAADSKDGEQMNTEEVEHLLPTSDGMQGGTDEC